MKTHRPGSRGRLVILPLLLLVVALVGVACAPAAPSATAVPAPSAAPTAPATSAPEPTVASGSEPVAKVDVPVGVDADGNFYRGDPKAAVKLVEYSDFQ
jgi:protein-disulfide isomerase